jgi:hypothetical protein
MDSREVDEAMRKRVPVMYEGEKYDRILEYVSSYDDNGSRRLSVGLLQGRNFYRVLASKVTLAEEE